MPPPLYPKPSRDEMFARWKKRVDQELSQRHGVVSDDLPDCPYRDWFDQSVNPRTAADRAVKNAKES